MLGRDAGAGCSCATLEVPDQRKTHTPTTIDNVGSLLMIERNLPPGQKQLPRRKIVGPANRALPTYVFSGRHSCARRPCEVNAGSSTGAMDAAVPNVWLPLTIYPLLNPDSDQLRDREDLCCRVFGRLAPRVSMTEAPVESSLLASRLRA